MGLVERLNELESMRQSGQISDSEYAMLVASATKKLGNENQLVGSTLSESLVNLDGKNAPRAMRFGESIKYSFKNYSNFSGRASRSEFWYWVLFVVLVAFSLSFAGALLVVDVEFLLSVFVLASIIPNLARIVRRLHDTNKPWQYMLFALVPLFGNILLTVWFCTKSDAGSNRFGPASATNDTALEMQALSRPIITSPKNEKTEAGHFSKSSLKSFSKNKKVISIFILAAIFFGVIQSHFQYGNLISQIELSEKYMKEYNLKYSEITGNLYDGSAGRFKSTQSRIDWEAAIKYESEFTYNLLVDAVGSVKDVWLAPWNMKHEEVSSKYIAHGLAWRNKLKEKSYDPYSNDYAAEIEATFRSFCRVIQKEAPWYTFGSFDSRIFQICGFPDSQRSNT
jgi:uncharacterized membrane protein YhaH (DUF805 family)